MRKETLKRLSCLAPFALLIAAGCDVKQTQEAKAPEVDVKEGQLPKFDVTAPRVDVVKEKEEVKVPKVNVTQESREITVPKVQVTPASEVAKDKGQ